MALMSMTGFADRAGEAEGTSWVWEARSVNGRGLDLRIRLPEGFEALEAPLRAAFGKAVARGSVSVGLRVARTAGAAAQRLNPAALEAAVEAALAAGEAASAAGLDLAPMTAGDLLGLRGVLETEPGNGEGNAAAVEAVAADIAPLVAGLVRARADEGAALARLLSAQIDRIADLTVRARDSAEARAARAGELLRTRIEAVLAATTVVDEARLAQELAMLAVKVDLTEELDRLDGHVGAARALLEEAGPVGRKFDFLTQEFNREANTLCAKAQAGDLTAIGLEMKVAIDQMREQVQNVE